MECDRNLKNGKDSKETFWEHPNHQNAPKNVASEAIEVYACTCFSLCRFVVVFAIPSQMLLFIQRGLVKMSLFYNGTMFHCDTLPRRWDRSAALCALPRAARCHELEMSVNASVWSAFPRHTRHVYLRSQQTNRIWLWQPNWALTGK